MSKNKKPTTGQSTIALNKKAKFDFFLGDRIEAGLVLEGWEVKALRAGKAQIADAHVIIKDGEAWLLGAVITRSCRPRATSSPTPPARASCCSTSTSWRA